MKCWYEHLRGSTAKFEPNLDMIYSEYQVELGVGWVSTCTKALPKLKELLNPSYNKYSE